MDIKQYHKQNFLEVQEKKRKKQEQLIVKGLQGISFNIKNNSKENWNKIANELIEEIYSSLEETLSLSLKLVKKLYGVKNKKLNIKTLTWNQDGKTLEDRVKGYCESIYLEIDLNNEPNEKILKNLMTYNLTRLLDTETMVIYNNSIYQLLKDEEVYASIEGAGNCEDGDCEAHISNKRVPIAELEALPPYHPDCECYVEYYKRKR